MLSNEEVATSRRTTRARQPLVPQGEARERTLLETAERLLRDGAYDSASIADIARGAGISRPTFYFYFASKQALLSSLVDRRLGELTKSLRDAVHDPRASPAELLRAPLYATADLWAEHGVVLATAAELAGSVPAVFDRIQAVNHAMLDSVIDLLAAAGTVPEARDPAAARELMLNLMWMSERTYYVLSRTNPPPEAFRELAGRLLTIWSRATGIAPD